MRHSRPLNPCDCLFYAFDQHMRGQGYTSGTGTFFMMDLVGRLEPNAVTAALKRTVQAHQTLGASVVISRWLARPVWRIAPEIVGPEYTFDDLSGEPDWPAAADRLCQERFSAGVDPNRPPLLRIEHYRGPHDQQRLCVRWSHALMDATGTQLFLAETDRLAQDQQPPPHILPDGQDCDPLAGRGWLRRARLAVRGLRTQDMRTGVQEASICNSLPERPVNTGRSRYLLRCWTPEQVERLRENARRAAPAGPALYSRYIAGCVLRAIYRIHAEHGRTLPVYGIMFPQGERGVERRPVTGNYLVAATLQISPERIGDKRAVAEGIAQQLQSYAQRKGDRDSRALQWLMAQLRYSQYRRVVEYQARTQPFATGYSFYGEIDPPLRQFLGAEVTNMWGCSLVSIPPGWNPVFSRFKDRVNWTLAWPEGVYPEGVVERYADLIEEEVFDT